MKPTRLARALALGLSTSITLISYGQTPVSDDFNQATLNTSLWTPVDPGGASGTSFGTFQTTGAGSGHSDLQIFVPAGDVHDAYTFNGALRLMQPVADTDFEVQAKFDSLPYQIGQEEGIMVEDANGVALRIDAGLVTTAGAYVDQWTGRGIGSAGAQISRVTMTDTPRPTNGLGIIYLRVKRQATQWTVWTSRNGADWIQRSSFSNDLVPARVGIHAGNYNPTAMNAPAFTVLVDYFFNTASPIIPWDGNPTNVPLPSVSITSPRQNALLAANSNLGINVDASVLGGTITNVQVFQGGTNLIGTATSSPFSVTWSNVPAGAHTLTATVTSDGGATRTSAGVKVIAVNSTGAIVSDDFSSSSVNAVLWTPVDPQGDSQFSVVGAGSGDSRLQIALTGAIEHDVWIQNHGARLMQLVTNQDFLVETKFDTLPSRGAQFEGILVEDANGVGLRFDAALNRNFGYLDAWTGRNINTSASAQQANRTLTDILTPPPGLYVGTVYLRVQKQGQEWTAWTSPDGATWTQNAFFTNTLEVARIGLFAGNAFSPVPAFTSQVDYFMNLAAPISTEDGSSNSPPVVNLTSPTPGATFAGTDTISVAATATEAKGSIAKVEFFTWAIGMTDPLLLGTDTSQPFEAQLANPGPGTRYLFAKATANAGATAWSQIVSVSLLSGINGAVVSDDFNAVSLNLGVWQIVDPVGNTSFSIDGAFTGDAHLLMRVPQGSTHDPYTSNTAFQLLQTVADQPFEFVVRFDSIPSLSIQEQGFLVKDPTNNFLRWNVQSDGQPLLRAFGTRIRAGAAANFLDARVADIVIPTSGNAGTMHMKLNYDGTFFAFSTSPDGTNWTEQSSRPEPWTVSQVGIYIGNAGANPAYTAWIDYFENTASPLTTEDGLVYPRLQLALAGGQIVISWPVANSSGFNLETTTGLSAPSWSSAGTPIVAGDQNTVTLPLGTGPSYYRLKK